MSERGCDFRVPRIKVTETNFHRVEEKTLLIPKTLAVLVYRRVPFICHPRQVLRTGFQFDPSPSMYGMNLRLASVPLMAERTTLDDWSRIRSRWSLVRGAVGIVESRKQEISYDFSSNLNASSPTGDVPH